MLNAHNPQHIMKDNSCKDVKDIEPYIQIDNGSFSLKKKTNERNTFTYLIDVNWEQCTHKYCQILIQISSFFIQRVDISKVRILFNKNLFKYIFDKKTNHFNSQSSFLNLLYVTSIMKYFE